MAQITKERPQYYVPELMTEDFLEVAAVNVLLAHDQVHIPSHHQFSCAIRLLQPEAVTSKSALLVGQQQVHGR